LNPAFFGCQAFLVLSLQKREARVPNLPTTLRTLARGLPHIRIHQPVAAANALWSAGGLPEQGAPM